MRNTVVMSVLVVMGLGLSACGEDPPQPPPPNFCPQRPAAQTPKPGQAPLLVRARPLPQTLLARRELAMMTSLARPQDAGEVGVENRAWWASPCLMGTPGLETATPRVAVVGGGRAVAVWTERDGLHEQLWFSEYIPETGWTSAEVMGLSREAPEDVLRVRQPQVVADSQGRALAVWLQSEGSAAAQLWFSRHSPGAGWSKPDRVLARSLGDATFLEAARDAAGTATLSWTQFDGDTLSENVWVTRGSPEAGFEDARRIDTPVPGFSVEPQVSVSGDGHAVVGWYRFDEMEGIGEAWFSRWTPGAGWSAAEKVSAEGVDSFFAEPLAGPGGAVLALWSELGAVNVELWARPFVPGTGWGEALRLEDALGTSGMAQASLEQGGRAMVVWPRFRAGFTRLSARPYDFAHGFSERQDVDAPPLTLGHAQDPQVVSLSRTQALVVWSHEREGSGHRIATSRYSAGRGWGRALLLDSEGVAQSGLPRLSVGPTGVGVATWLHRGAVPGLGVSVFQ
ncbi:hypothetical protein [Myxococcus qinghaiensis]|uniref:hypothetical protein n=1 Tax=Myxococcus qinghaiensis TaxID=2906758 RepID=UPI0020A6EF0E|nr:hypothetical protein [Myxococcus qinghaiensis]MCP3165378.1 hypothetical protein [Myxococcus qinghaiensis]